MGRTALPNGPHRKVELALQDPPTVSTVLGFGPVEILGHETLETCCFSKDDAIVIKLTVCLEEMTI